MAFLVALLTFVATLIVCGALWVLFEPISNPQLVRSRMKAVQKFNRAGDVALDLELIRDEDLSSVPILNRLMMRLAWSRRLKNLITQAGLQTKPGKILLISAVMGLGAYVIVGYVYHQLLLALLAALIGLAAPVSIVAILRGRRMRQFELRFPEALDLLGRAVRVGHAFTTGMEMVSTECPEPVAGEFRTTFDEQNLGLPLRDALVNLTERVPSVDVRFFATALLVQKETGGNLAELLDELSRVIRERFRIRREVQVKTAQGRLTAVILVALPVAMLILLKVMNPSYVNVLFTDPVGPEILAGAAALQVIGAVIIWKIVHIEV
jgi:tight adherence protein B